MEKNGKIKTSIIIPVYNVEAYVADCLDSLLKQTQKEIQVIVVEDASTDKSLDIVKGYQYKFDNMQILTQCHSGLGAARNRGCLKAEGEFVYYLDADDWIREDTLETCYAYAKAHNLEAVLFDAEVVYEVDIHGKRNRNLYDRSGVVQSEQTYSGREFLKRYLTKEPQVESSCMMYVQRTFLERNQLFFEEGIFHEDVDYYFRLMREMNRLRYLPEKFYYRRFRAGSIKTSDMKEERLEGYYTGLFRMLEAAEADNGTDKEYIARKMWLAFEQYRKLREDGEFPQLEAELKKLCRTYLKKFSCRIPEGQEGLYLFQEEERDCILQECLQKLPLGEEGKIVGIYGLGIHTEKLLKEYERLIGKIHADVLFLDSYKQTGSMKYRDCDVCNIMDIGETQIKEIIISSYFFQEELCEKVKGLYGSQYKLYCFYDKYPFLLFNWL